MSSKEHASSEEAAQTLRMRKRDQIHTYYLKEEPRTIEAEEETDISRQSFQNVEETNLLHLESSVGTISSIPNSESLLLVEPQSYASETIVPDIIPSDSSNILLEPRRKGRPKKKPLSILTPVEISKNLDAKASKETSEALNEHLYAGFLGRTRRTTRQSLEGLDAEGNDESAVEDDSPKRGRPYGAVKNRGRGRGRTRPEGTPSGSGKGGRRMKSAEVPDDDINYSQEITGGVSDLGDVETDNFLPDEPRPVFLTKACPIVKCGKCKEELPKNEWNKHNLMKHNDTGWLEGQSPRDFNNDEKGLKKILFIAIKKRKGQLTCERCGVVKRSVIGLLSHIRFCGKSEKEKKELMVQCPRCHSTVKPTSFYTHERNCQADRKTTLSYTQEIDPVTFDGKSRRKAAQKAVSRISQFTMEINNANKEKILPHTVKNFIQNPHLERKIVSNIKSSFQKELVLKGSARCKQSECDFTGTTLEEISEHYAMCNFVPEENYVCKVCNFHSLIHKEVIDHVLETHAISGTSDHHADPDHDIKSEESSEPSDLDEGYDKNYDMNERLSTRPHFIPETTEENIRASRALFLENERMQNPKHNVPFNTAYQWTLEFEVNNYQLNLFDDLLPNEFNLLAEDVAESYLPELKKSMSVKKELGTTSERIIDLHGPLEVQWKHYKRFEGSVEGETPTFFVGGPVWALAWLPISIPMYSYQPNQYLAVSTHPKMESEYLISKEYSEKNVIQIWEMGRLNYKNDDLWNPEFSYAVAHNGGTIWCMEWCPSGCYQDSRIVEFNANPDKLRRMGLLAAACSDGSVHIYSLPFPEELKFPDEERAQLPIYETSPVMLLVVSIVMFEAGKQNWQCTKLSWTKENGHNILAAGFSNGYIALWNLAIKSQILKKKQGNTMLLNCFRHFYAHNHSVSMISMIPYGEKRFLVSASLDRCYKVWHLEQPYCVESVSTRGLTVDGTWMMHWPLSVLSYDDALGLSHTNSQIIPLREHSYKYFPISSTNSPTYILITIHGHCPTNGYIRSLFSQAISASDHANAIVQGNLAGEIVAIFPHQLLYKDIENYLHKKRWLCSYVQVTDFQSSNNGQEIEKEREKNEYNYKPSTYVGCSERFGISFSDDFRVFRSCKTKPIKKKIMPTDQLETVSIEQYPFASVNRISWNPNAWSYLWFAAGYQNGLIRILDFNSVNETNDLKTQLPRFAKVIIEKYNQARDDDRFQRVK